MSEEPTGQFYEPQDRLTRMGDAMTTMMDGLPEYRVGDKAIVFVRDEERSGITMHGYDDPLEAIGDLFLHLQAIMRANGKDLQFIGIPESPEGL
jgi:hypothetical protein